MGRLNFPACVLSFCLAASAFSPAMFAQSAAASANPQEHTAPAAVPDLFGPWIVPPNRPSFDPADPKGEKPESLPMTPWAEERFKAARPGFGARATFENVTDPVQKFCDPPGPTRLYLYPWNFSLIQRGDFVYILYEFTGLWRPIALHRVHPKDPDSTWWGDSIGWYEGETLVVDTVGFNDKTWIDQVGHPHSEQLHLIERFRRLDPGTLEVTVTFEDPKAFTHPFTEKRIFKRSTAPLDPTVCAVSEMQGFDDAVMKTTTTPPKK
jgi:hypothetical protein